MEDPFAIVGCTLAALNGLYDLPDFHLKFFIEGFPVLFSDSFKAYPLFIEHVFVIYASANQHTVQAARCLMLE